MNRSCIAAAAALAVALPALGQEAQRIEITGSSIKRIDAETAVPVQVLTRQDIQRSGATNVEQLMLTLGANTSSGAQLANAASGATTGSISSISLRGLSCSTGAASRRTASASSATRCRWTWAASRSR
jgi:iron complex outermembrane recepter protein